MAPVKSLMELATAVCIKNIRHLQDVGDYIPYGTLREILSRVESAEQLRTIELNSAQIQGKTAELWIKLIEKDFPMEHKANAYKPTSAEKWYKVWEKYKREHDNALAESENKLKMALAGLRQDKARNTSMIVERKYLPRAGHIGPRRPFGGRGEMMPSALTFNKGSRTKTHTGASVMKKVRREAREIASIKGRLSSHIRAPARHAAQQRAPAAMIDDHRRAGLPQYRVSDHLTASADQYQERATFISDSDEDDAPPVSPAKTKATPSTARGSVSETAQVSLLKRRPAALRGAPATKPIIKIQPAEATSRARAQPKVALAPASGAKPAAAAATSTEDGRVNVATKSSSSTLASKSRRTPADHGPPTGQARTTTAPRFAAPADKLDPDKGRRTTPPPRGSESAEPSSPEGGVPSLASPSQPPPRKRKTAVDIFMRPKKRMH
ncbi:hypothetical protein RJ55_00384 [Drechmeria coniospora]|nr:hypothetical protein RJ55_00384 [Drechmeria coniospora]